MRPFRLLCVLLFALGLAGLPPARAQDAAVSSSPYTVTLPVGDTSAAQRDQTFATALGQVLARVSAGQDLRGRPGYDDALQGASGMVSQYHYLPAGDSLALQVTFDRGAINHLVGQLGAPAAGVKPPLLLLVQGADGRLLDGSSLDALARAAAAQGYGVVYTDPTDPPALDRVIAVDPAAMAQLTARYRTGLVLVGRLHGASADWTLVSGGAAQSWQASGVSEDALLADAGPAFAARVASQLNVIGSGTSEGTLWVDGVVSAMDYAQLLSLLRSDASVRQVGTVAAKGDGVLLKVSSSLPLDALAANLAAGGRLLRAATPHEGATATLSWLH